MAKINQTIPQFETQAFVPGEKDFVTINSETDVKGKWSVFLFYPADFTFVCPTELEDMQNVYGELKELGVEVYAVSTDSHFVHKAWHENSEAISKVTYPMLGDTTGAITRGFDIMIEEAGQALRGTFIVNPEGVIKVAEIHDLGIGRSAKDTLRKVKAAQYVANHDGEVCPAAWEEGQATLAPSLDLVGKI
ncbi:alkyl hydroperoxide reductase subunit C [Alteromonas sp. LMIT006]|jgi:peroxiredoxin (alkyl hydroperoxide reductase subunit C)|nr:alkyl hydroperoxide reductase subunit C [Alteromonas sp. LMIT006]MBE1286231.1 peroxiredoxin [Alteromonadaceae bacterium]UTP72781.1 alkyl hydroperoxide reductase subunit C [Alteromonas sp. LMIT006]